MSVALKVWENGVLKSAKLTTPRANKGRFVKTNSLYVILEDGTVSEAHQDQQGKLYVLSGQERS